MSTFLPDSGYVDKDISVVAPADKGAGAQLTPSEKDLIKKIFSRPELIPDEFLAYLVDYLTVNQPNIPISAIRGFFGFVPDYATTGDESHMTSTTYADPNVSGAAGPSITDLPKGRYLFLFGASGQGSVSGSIFMALSINGSTPGDADSCEFQVGTAHVPGARAIVSDLTSDINTVAAKYRSQTGADGDVRYRWLVAIKYADLAAS